MDADKLLCRLCRSSNDVVLSNIFKNENASVVEEIEFLLKEKPSINDGLPPYVCHRCSYRVQAHKTFRDVCTESLRELQKKQANSDDDDIIVLETKPCTPTPRASTPHAPASRASTPHAPASRAPTPRAPTPHSPTPRTPVPCSSEYRTQSSSNEQDIATRKTEERDSYMSETANSSRSKRCKRHKMKRPKQEGGGFFKKRSHSPDTSRLLLRQVFQPPQYIPEVLPESGKIQHALVGSATYSPTLTETPPEVVDEQLGTVGYIVQEPSSSQAAPSRHRMDMPLLTPRMNSLHPSSFSDNESYMSEQNKVYRLCCRGVPENSEVFAPDHLVTMRRGNDSSCTYLVQPSSQARMHRPMSSYAETSLSTVSPGPITCHLCCKVFTNRIIFRQHLKEKHSQVVFLELVERLEG